MQCNISIFRFNLSIYSKIFKIFYDFFTHKLAGSINYKFPDPGRRGKGKGAREGARSVGTVT